MKLLCAFCLMVWFFAGCSGSGVEHSGSGKLLFHSGFEPNTELINETSRAVEIVGMDQSVRPPNDWVNDLEQSPVGRFNFQYQGGDTSQRRVTIVPDPTDNSNHVVRYWLKHVNVNADAAYGGKGRIQANVYGNQNLKNFYYRIRMYFHSDWQYLRDWNEEVTAERHSNGWFILAEFWNNGGWTGEGYPFRVHITINNDPESGNALHFGVGGQVRDNGWQEIWHEINKTFSIPLKEWLTAEVYFKEGKGENGRFYFAVTQENGTKTVIFNIHNTTCHPDDPAPDGFTHFNPMKMYTHNKNIHRVREQGGAIQIYWDDFELWTDKTPQ